MRTNELATNGHSLTTDNSPWLEVVRQKVGSLSFGFVQITVHESNVVQIEMTERVRFQPTKQEPSIPQLKVRSEQVR